MIKETKFEVSEHKKAKRPSWSVVKPVVGMTECKLEASSMEPLDAKEEAVAISSSEGIY